MESLVCDIKEGKLSYAETLRGGQIMMESIQKMDVAENMSHIVKFYFNGVQTSKLF